MKSVLLSIQPYYVFLIIAHLMGWNLPQNKTIEVRKDYPKDGAWNKVTRIYCSKNTKSFNRIPKQYQPFMKGLLGKVIGEFVCDSIEKIDLRQLEDTSQIQREACLTRRQLFVYLKEKGGYLWHISDLKIYDIPKALCGFKKPPFKRCKAKFETDKRCFNGCPDSNCTYRTIYTPPQSWCYVEA